MMDGQVMESFAGAAGDDDPTVPVEDGKTTKAADVERIESDAIAVTVPVHPTGDKDDVSKLEEKGRREVELIDEPEVSTEEVKDYEKKILAEQEKKAAMEQLPEQEPKEQNGQDAENTRLIRDEEEPREEPIDESNVQDRTGSETTQETTQDDDDGEVVVVKTLNDTTDNDNITCNISLTETSSPSSEIEEDANGALQTRHSNGAETSNNSNGQENNNSRERLLATMNKIEQDDSEEKKDDPSVELQEDREAQEESMIKKIEDVVTVSSEGSSEICSSAVVHVIEGDSVRKVCLQLDSTEPESETGGLGTSIEGNTPEDSTVAFVNLIESEQAKTESEVDQEHIKADQESEIEVAGITEEKEETRDRQKEEGGAMQQTQTLATSEETQIAGAPRRDSLVSSLRAKFERNSGNLSVDMEKFYMNQRAQLATYQMKKREALFWNYGDTGGKEGKEIDVDDLPLSGSVALIRRTFEDRHISYVFAVHKKKGLLLKKLVPGEDGTPRYEVPAGIVAESDYSDAERESGNMKERLLLASRLGAARELFAETGLDVRGCLDRLVPANVMSDESSKLYEDMPLLQNQFQQALMYFLILSDDDCLDGVAPPDLHSVKSAESSDHNPELGSNHAQSFHFVFESDPVEASKRLESKGFGVADAFILSLQPDNPLYDDKIKPMKAQSMRKLTAFGNAAKVSCNNRNSPPKAQSMRNLMALGKHESKLLHSDEGSPVRPQSMRELRTSSKDPPTTEQLPSFFTSVTSSKTGVTVESSVSTAATNASTVDNASNNQTASIPNSAASGQNSKAKANTVASGTNDASDAITPSTTTTTILSGLNQVQTSKDPEEVDIQKLHTTWLGTNLAAKVANKLEKVELKEFTSDGDSAASELVSPCDSMQEEGSSVRSSSVLDGTTDTESEYDCGATCDESVKGRRTIPAGDIFPASNWELLRENRSCQLKNKIVVADADEVEVVAVILLRRNSEESDDGETGLCVLNNEKPSALKRPGQSEGDKKLRVTFSLRKNNSNANEFDEDETLCCWVC
ncbi:NUDIX domain [Seminavis robusta]|uniref:NUDIX domain n=1 Tax=Seminavis robusta TaxID=568900 RepID=A0A9N8D9K0_9STRA|nr:NUDIX domain [Seminavis robusta]|eukprot:Sro24_g016650.1 NUDIX domain (1033) ;mRNA; r:166792-170067